MKCIKIWFCDFFSGFSNDNNGYINILKKHYNTTLDPDKPDFLIYSCYGFSHVSFKNCVKIFATGEAIIPNFNECDYAIGFSPLKFGYRYFQNKPHINFNMKEIDSSLLDRKFCNFIYSQDDCGEGALLRKAFCKMLMDYKKVDAPGKILNNMTDAINSRYSADWYGGKLEFIKNYKFTFAIENGEMDGYITEKLIQPLQMHSIPIYWGALDVGDYLNTKAFINLRDFNSLQDALEYIRYVDNNDDEYMKILKTDPNLSNDEEDDNLENFLCSIIERGNRPFSKSPLMCHEPQVIRLCDYASRLAKFYLNCGNVSKAKECAELCLSLETRSRINIYPLLEDIYSSNLDEFLMLLERQKRNLLGSNMIRPEYLAELCKIATCYVHIGEIPIAKKLIEYVLKYNPDLIEAKSILSKE